MFLQDKKDMSLKSEFKDYQITSLAKWSLLIWKLNNKLGFWFHWILYDSDHFSLSPTPTADAEQYNADLPTAPLKR